MTTPRTRTRARPHAQENRTEQKVAGTRVATSADTAHKPVGETEILETPGVALVARVRIMDGVTLNMGDYNSFRRDVGLEMDVALGAPGAEPGSLTAEQQRMVDVAYDKAAAWVEARMEAVVEDAQEYFDKIG